MHVVFDLKALRVFKYHDKEKKKKSVNCQNTKQALEVSSSLELTHCTSWLRTRPSWIELPLLKMGTEF